MSSAGDEASSTQSELDAGKLTSRAGSGPARTPAAAGAGGTGASGAADTLADAGIDAANADAGAAGAAGATGSVDSGDSDANCELDGGCAVTCTGQTADCTVVPVGFACEFDGFVGATQHAECGVNVSVGTACCGGCGCVAVDVFYDGRRCWQGIPDCALDQFAGKVFAPHAPDGH
jgi:hypothetical protein